METLCNFFWADAYLNTQAKNFQPLSGSNMANQMHKSLSHLFLFGLFFLFYFGAGMHLYNQFMLVQTAEFQTFYG